jgi:hypothetical protein
LTLLPARLHNAIVPGGTKAVVWLLLGCGIAFLLCGGLGALLFGPVMIEVKETQATSDCLEHVRALATAASLYVEDHGAYMPAGRWMDELLPYHVGEDQLHCPAFGGDERRYGYAMNSEVATQAPADIEDHAATALFYDSVNLMRNASDPVTSLPPDGRHRTTQGRGNIIARVDGSAKLEPPGTR